MERVWSLLGMSGDWAQEGCTVLYWPQSNGEVFLFQHRVTPHTVTWMSPAELLMGRKLRDKLPQVEFCKEQATEAYWQQQLRKRDARAKLRQKYADRTRQEQLNTVTLKQEKKRYRSRHKKIISHLITSQIHILSLTRMEMLLSHKTPMVTTKCAI